MLTSLGSNDRRLEAEPAVGEAGPGARGVVTELRHKDMGPYAGQSVACLLGYNSIRANQLVEPCCKKKEMNMTIFPL